MIDTRYIEAVGKVQSVKEEGRQKRAVTDCTTIDESKHDSFGCSISSAHALARICTVREPILAINVGLGSSCTHL